MTTQLPSKDELEILSFNGQTHTERMLARALLAAYEQEPVYIDKNGYEAITGLLNKEFSRCGRYVSISRSSGEPIEKRYPIYLRPAPSIPAAVPEECPAQLSDQIVDICDGFVVGDSLAQEIWNTCRAAMLQSGWIPVSERLPDDDTYVVAADIAHGEIYSAFAAWFVNGRFSVMDGLSASNHDGGAIIEIDMPITHWRPLPAAPKVTP